MMKCAALFEGSQREMVPANFARDSVVLNQSKKNAYKLHVVETCLNRLKIRFRKNEYKQKYDFRKHGGNAFGEYDYVHLTIDPQSLPAFLRKIGFLSNSKQARIGLQVDYRETALVTRVERISCGPEMTFIDLGVEDQDNPYFYANNVLTHNSYPSTSWTRCDALFEQDCDVKMHIFAGTIKPQPPNIITLDINPEITIRRKTKKQLKSQDKGHRRIEVIRPTIADDIRNLGYNVKVWRDTKTPPKIGNNRSYILREGRTKVRRKGKTMYPYWWIVRKYGTAYRKIFSVVDVVFADPPYPGKFEKFKTTPFDKRQVIRDLGALMPKGSFLCWFDTLYPMFRKSDWQLIGSVEVKIGTNTQVRAGLSGNIDDALTAKCRKCHAVLSIKNCCGSCLKCPRG